MSKGYQLYPFARTAALFLVCQNYHSGQWSRGYRLMCRLKRRLQRAGFSTQYDVMNLVSDRAYCEQCDKEA